MPAAARRYQIELGHDVLANFLLIKPIIAGLWSTARWSTALRRPPPARGVAAAKLI